MRRLMLSQSSSHPLIQPPSGPALRGPAFFAYADNYLIDLKAAVIVDVEASRAVRQAEVGAARTMLERTACVSACNVDPLRRGIGFQIWL